MSNLDHHIQQLLGNWGCRHSDEIILDYCKYARSQGEVLSKADLDRERIAFERLRRRT